MATPEEEAAARARVLDLDYTPVPQKHAGPRRAADVGTEAMLNAGPSAIQYGSNIVQTVAHPIETAKAVGSLFTDPNARAVVGDFYKDRYGSWENIKRTIAQDPVGFMGDVALPFTGIGAALRAPAALGSTSKAAQVAGRVGQASSRVGAAVDPLTNVGRAAGLVGRGAGNVGAATLGVTTGAGMKPFREAARIGWGGTLEENLAFLSNYQRTVPSDKVVRDAKDAVKAIRQERGAAYDRQMGLLNLDATRLDFAPIQDALSKIIDSAHTRIGTSVLDDADRAVLDRVINTLAQWEANPAEHTVNGLDGLKKRIRGIYPTPDNTQASRIVGNLESAVKNVIETQAPEYAQVMNAYATESKLLDELEATLSIGNTKTTDTALRKLQSVMRDNANTNYGQRAGLVDTLDERGGKQIVPALAGQALSQWDPRGLARAAPTIPFAAAGMNLAQGQPIAAAASLAPLVLNSPRVMGGATYWSARTARAIADAARAAGVTAPRVRGAGQAAFQAGRVPGLLEEETWREEPGLLLR